MKKRFVVRAYGLLLQDRSVLVTEEVIRGSPVTKFPGGGLEFGEGVADCVVREFSEELGLDVRILGHYYTTDFFVLSAFDPDVQVISVYYRVDSGSQSFPVISERAKSEGLRQFRWIGLETISEDDLSLVIDKKVAAMLREQYKRGML